MSNKSEATWHPAAQPTPPEGPRADLIEKLWAIWRTDEVHPVVHANVIRDAAAALSDSVPREQYDEALAIIERVREVRGTPGRSWEVAIVLARILDEAPADALARVKAEAGAQALDQFAATLSHDSEVLKQNGDTHASWGQVADIAEFGKLRAAALREQHLDDRN